MHGQYRRMMPPRQRQRAGRPGRIAEHPTAAAGDAAGGVDHDRAFGVQRGPGQGQGQSGALERALGFDPLHRDEHLGQPRIDPQGVGVGEEQQVGPDRLQGVVHRHTVGEPGRMVDDHDQPAPGRDALQPAGRDPELQEAGGVVQRLPPAEAGHRVGHVARAPIVQHRVEKRPDQRPRRRVRQARGALADQHIDDVLARQGRRR